MESKGSLPHSYHITSILCS